MLGVEPVRGAPAPIASCSASGCARRRRRRSPSSATATSRPTRPVGDLHAGRRSSSSRSRARWRSAAASSSSTSRRAASATPTCSALFELIARLKAQGHRDRLHLALHRGSEGGLGSLRRAARRTQRRRAARRAATPAEAIVGLMVGRDARRALSARRARRRASRSSSSTDVVPGAATLDACAAARFSASPGCSAPGARGCCARSSASSRCTARPHHGRRVLRPAGAARAVAAGDGDAERGSRRRGPGARAERRRQPDADAARAARSRPSRCCRRGRTRPRARWIDRLGIRVRASAPDRSASCPAATSRRWRSGGCCTTTSTCWCSTSRRAASTSRSKAQIYTLDRRAGVRPGDEGRARSSAATCRSCSASAIGLR